LTRWVEEKLNGKKVEVEIQTWPKLIELFKLKDLIKLMTGLIDLIKNLIKTKLIKFGSQFGKKNKKIN
jgi:hypothetical protein